MCTVICPYDFFLAIKFNTYKTKSKCQHQKFYKRMFFFFKLGLICSKTATWVGFLLLKIAQSYFNTQKIKKKIVVLSIPIMKCTKWKVFSNCTENIFIFLVILLLLLHFLPSSLLNGGQISGFLRWLEFCDNLLSTHWNLKQKTILQLHMNNVSRHTSMTPPTLNTSLF